MLPMPAMATSFGLEDCDLSFKIHNPNSNDLLCLHRTHTYRTVAKIYTNGTFKDAPEGEYSTGRVGWLPAETLLVDDTGEVYVKAAVERTSLQDSSQLRFYWDDAHVQYVRRCDLSAIICRTAPDGTYTTLAGTEIPIKDGHIRYDHDVPSVVCYFQRDKKKETIQCEDRN